MDWHYITQQNHKTLNTTESPSYYDNLEKMSIKDLLTNINKEDHTVPQAIAKIIPNIEILIEKIVEKTCFWYENVVLVVWFLAVNLVWVGRNFS